MTERRLDRQTDGTRGTIQKHQILKLHDRGTGVFLYFLDLNTLVYSLYTPIEYICQQESPLIEDFLFVNEP